MEYVAFNRKPGSQPLRSSSGWGLEGGEGGGGGRMPYLHPGAGYAVFREFVFLTQPASAPLGPLALELAHKTWKCTMLDPLEVVTRVPNSPACQFT